VTFVTIEHIAINHFEMISSRSHSSFLSILTEVDRAVPHIQKLILILMAPPT